MALALGHVGGQLAGPMPDNLKPSPLKVKTVRPHDRDYVTGRVEDGGPSATGPTPRRPVKSLPAGGAVHAGKKPNRALRHLVMFREPGSMLPFWLLRRLAAKLPVQRLAANRAATSPARSGGVECKASHQVE